MGKLFKADSIINTQFFYKIKCDCILNCSNAIIAPNGFISKSSEAIIAMGSMYNIQIRKDLRIIFTCS